MSLFLFVRAVQNLTSCPGRPKGSRREYWWDLALTGLSSERRGKTNLTDSATLSREGETEMSETRRNGIVIFANGPRDKTDPTTPSPIR